MAYAVATTPEPSSRSSSTRLAELVDRAAAVDLRRRVLGVFRRIESDRYLDETMRLLSETIAGAAPYWDMCCALAAFAELRRPRNYLEIGVRRGRSASIVAAFQPDVSLYLFDMWHPDYAGVPNPGPDFVRAQLARVGHRGEVRFVDGRSQQTVPAFFEEPGCPPTFDLITVDGDHRDAGARADLEAVAPRLAVGGTLVFDDISHPTYPTLYDTWRVFVDERPELVAHENRVDATGTALAVRKY
jgi:predicted O-methyltransferase YrrM